MIEIRLIEPQPPDPHDHDHPDDERNLQAAAQLLRRNPRCHTCGILYRLVAGPGAEWVIDHVHEVGCPEDAEPEAVEVCVTGGYDAGVHREAEAIWSKAPTARRGEDDSA